MGSRSASLTLTEQKKEVQRGVLIRLLRSYPFRDLLPSLLLCLVDGILDVQYYSLPLSFIHQFCICILHLTGKAR